MRKGGGEREEVSKGLVDIILEKQDAVFKATSGSELSEKRHRPEREQLEDLCCAIRMKIESSRQTWTE